MADPKLPTINADPSPKSEPEEIRTPAAPSAVGVTSATHSDGRNHQPKASTSNTEEQAAAPLRPTPIFIDGAGFGSSAVPPSGPQIGAEPLAIAKPGAFSLDKFKSKRAAAMANVETLPNALAIHSIAQAKDFVRLHSDDANFWSPELCFVNVPIRGANQDRLHLIDEDIAMQFLPSARIQRFRLALACKPNDTFFLCQVPTRNLENTYNASNIEACELAKTLWTQATSRREEGVDAYKLTVARDPDAFPQPKWPPQSLAELIERALPRIEHQNHPGLLRLIGARQTP
jgi:hypothetical protein